LERSLRTETVREQVHDLAMTSSERQDLISTLGKHRGFLRQTALGLSDEQAAATPTASALCIGGIIKHVTSVEDRWRRFIVEGPSAMASPGRVEEYQAGFRLLPGETLESVLESYDGASARTDELIGSLPSLDADHPLPEAPWFEPGARWSARRVLVHILAETAQHAGHADIIRETIDGARTMG
jgi:uncharacterized damage-inducible protein DinB